ncbi:MAG: VCBS repeat-containing protein [Planctomycetales bacterium]|nr:VCBS repeat-containing protein [Planctomycetales bacterium]
MNNRFRRSRPVETLEDRHMLTVLQFADPETIKFGGSSVREAQFVDFTGDGNIDILSDASDSLLHRGNGSLEFADPEPLPGRSGVPLLVDIDGDGDKDLVYSRFVSLHTTTFEVYRNTPEHPRLFRKLIDNDDLSHAANVLDAADIDGDGDLDLVGGFAYSHHDTYARTASIHWYENTDGRGDFEVRMLDAKPDNFGGALLRFTDFDGDGDNDIVANHAWYENADHGKLFHKHSIDDASLAYDLGDLDGDGVLDLLTEARRHQVGWRENIDGTGKFAAQRTIDGGIQTRFGGAELTDMDFDGDLDLLAIDTYRQTLSWYENYSGKGDFGRRHVIMEGLRHVTFVDATDVDGDGDIDILTKRANSTLILLEGQGPVAPGDSNKDGVFDSSDLVHVFEAGKYEDAQHHNTVFEEGDWNGDGDFNSTDFVYAFQFGEYRRDATLAAINVDGVFDSDDRNSDQEKRLKRFTLDRVELHQ